MVSTLGQVETETLHPISMVPLKQRSLKRKTAMANMPENEAQIACTNTVYSCFCFSHKLFKYFSKNFTQYLVSIFSAVTQCSDYLFLQWPGLFCVSFKQNFINSVWFKFWSASSSSCHFKNTTFLPKIFLWFSCWTVRWLFGGLWF